MVSEPTREAQERVEILRLLLALKPQVEVAEVVRPKRGQSQTVWMVVLVVVMAEGRPMLLEVRELMAKETMAQARMARMAAAVVERTEPQLGRPEELDLPPP